MNTKAMEPMIMVSLILGIVLLGVAAYAFVPKTIDTATDFINNKLKDFGLKTEEIPTQVIDEERISEGKKIPVDSITNDRSSGFTNIVKQEYGKGWNLEHLEPLLKFREEECIYEQKCTPTEPLIANKPLLEILSSDKLYGSITVNRREYAHTKNTEEHDPNTPDLYWKIILSQDDATITYGNEEIPAEDIKNIILNSLYEEATS